MPPVVPIRDVARDEREEDDGDELHQADHA